MDEPLTRDEKADDLFVLHWAFRKSVAKHHTSRLELLFWLQFPDLESASGIEAQLLQDMDIMFKLEQVAMEAVSRHPLFTEVRLRQDQLLAQTQVVLSAVVEGKLDAGLFRSLIKAMQRFDVAVNRFDMGITASLTNVDELTGLLNRTAMDRDLKRELAQAKRSGKPLCLAMIDADHFKKVNDDYSHSFGDIVLEELADRFEATLRPRDSIYRYGGEEFLAALPDTGLDQAEKVMNRLRVQSAKQPISNDEISITQTVSIGLAEVHTDEAIDTAIERADAALYQAKEAGRNQVIAAMDRKLA